jgi:hypothetical protein
MVNTIVLVQLPAGVRAKNITFHLRNVALFTTEGGALKAAGHLRHEQTRTNVSMRRTKAYIPLTDSVGMLFSGSI